MHSFVTKRMISIFEVMIKLFIFHTFFVSHENDYNLKDFGTLSIMYLRTGFHLMFLFFILMGTCSLLSSVHYVSLTMQ